MSLDHQLRETLECARREKPALVLITLGFFDERSVSDPRWGAFVHGARTFLDEDYEKVSEAYPGFEVWKRQAAPPS